MFIFGRGTFKSCPRQNKNKYEIWSFVSWALSNAALAEIKHAKSGISHPAHFQGAAKHYTKKRPATEPRPTRDPPAFGDQMIITRPS